MFKQLAKMKPTLPTERVSSHDAPKNITEKTSIFQLYLHPGMDSIFMAWTEAERRISLKGERRSNSLVHLFFAHSDESETLGDPIHSKEQHVEAIGAQENRTCRATQN